MAIASWTVHFFRWWPLWFLQVSTTSITYNCLSVGKIFFFRHEIDLNAWWTDVVMWWLNFNRHEFQFHVKICLILILFYIRSLIWMIHWFGLLYNLYYRPSFSSFHWIFNIMCIWGQQNMQPIPMNYNVFLSCRPINLLAKLHTRHIIFLRNGIC